MWDMMMQPSLAAAVVDSADLRSMLMIMFAGIVGLAAGLVIIEAIRHYYVRHRKRMTNTPGPPSSPRLRARDVVVPINAHPPSKFHSNLAKKKTEN